MTNLTGEDLPAEPDVAFTPHEDFYGSYHVTGNKLTEGTSFETGATGALDGGWYWKEMRSYKRWLDAEDEDYLTYHSPPRVVDQPSPGPHGQRCVEIRMRNRSVTSLSSRPFQAQYNGRHTFSASILGDPSISYNDRALVSLHIKKFPTGELVAKGGGKGDTVWTRQSTTENIHNLIAGEWYRAVVLFGAWDSSQDYLDQSVWVDALHVAYGSGTTYSHPTSGWQIGARVCRTQLGIQTDRVPYDTFWLGEDNGMRKLAVDIYAENLIAGPVTLTVNLYDSSGIPGDVSTRLATRSQDVTPTVGETSSYLITLDTMLAQCDNAPGFYLVETVLTDSQDNPIDLQQTPFMLLHRAPAVIADIENSPFGGHPHAIMSPIRHGYYDFWYSFGLETNAPADEMLEYLRDLGIRWTREFQLFNFPIFDNYHPSGPTYPYTPPPAWDQPEEAPTTFTEYTALLQDLNMKTFPVFHYKGHNIARQAEYIHTMVETYEPYGVDQGEFFNEQNISGFNPSEYYANLWRSYTEIQGMESDFILGGPAPSWCDSAYINEVLSLYDNGPYGYDMLDIVTYHRYLKTNASFPWNLIIDENLRSQATRSPEDVCENAHGRNNCSEWEMRLMKGETVQGCHWDPVQKPADLGGGPVEQPIWNSECGPSAPMARRDQPYLDIGTDEFFGGMSGSLTLGRRMAARFDRLYLCSFEHEHKKMFAFRTLPGHGFAGYRWFEPDKTPTVFPAAMSYLAHMLEGYDFADKIYVEELPDNNVNPYYTRAQFYLERNPEIPGDPRAVAVLWNWADDHFDHLAGSGVVDNVDPAPVAGETLIPILDIDPSKVEVSDLMGKTLSFAGLQITNLALNHEPVFIRTKPGTTPGELMMALDELRPGAPSQPSVSYNGLTGIVTISTTFPQFYTDVSGYRCYRKDYATGIVTLVVEGEILPLYDDPPKPGKYCWYLTVIEEYTGYESEMSPASQSLKLLASGPKGR